ncbi:hypothetical protein ACE1TI_20710 [Alteribacillus sp. JSM 102045]|uniref:hypothetical protein n=1 Tax=Alteribacillus sp. JSM 102045 TaxID=1562101 RepID=UPI0035BECD3E
MRFKVMLSFLFATTLLFFSSTLHAQEDNTAESDEYIVEVYDQNDNFIEEIKQNREEMKKQKEEFSNQLSTESTLQSTYTYGETIFSNYVWIDSGKLFYNPWL